MKINLEDLKSTLEVDLVNKHSLRVFRSYDIIKNEISDTIELVGPDGVVNSFVVYNLFTPKEFQEFCSKNL